jgi:RNA polymerase sigma-70 factor (ECF subfamily)
MELSQAYSGVISLQETERDVIERWRKGDKRAFEKLVKRHMADAYLTALGFTGNPEDARDLSQDAFVKAYQARRRFDPEKPFYPWFHRILRNHCLNFLKRVRRKTEPLYFDDALDNERFKSSKPSPLEQLEKKERVRLLRAAIDRLSAEHREVIVLKSFRGLSYREMADVLGTPIGTVMSRLYYARRMLREIITGWERGESDVSTQAHATGQASPEEAV